MTATETLAEQLLDDPDFMEVLKASLRNRGPLLNMAGEDISTLAAAIGRVQVSPGQSISSSSWGNPVWDQSVNVFNTAADRDSQWPTPHEGSVCYQLDSHTPWVYRSGVWRGLPLGSMGAASGPTSGADYSTFVGVTGASVTFQAQPGRRYIAHAFATGLVVSAASNQVLVSMRSSVGVDRADPINTAGQSVPVNATVVGAAFMPITNSGAAHNETVSMTASSNGGAFRVAANAITLIVLDVGS
jgi:hypothetical protein